MILPFPYEGIDKGRALCEQPAYTASRMNNIRPRDVLANRLRGGQRPGLDKWGAGVQIGAAEQPVVAICIVSSVQ